MVLWIGPGVRPGGGRFGLPWSAPWRWEVWVALECALEVGGRVALEF